MDVTGVESKKGKYTLEHTCRTCGLVNGDHMRPEDNMDALISYVKAHNDKLSKQ